MRFILVLLTLILSQEIVFAGVVIRSLEDAIDVGLRNNKDLRAKLLDVASADANMRGALSDLLLPSVNATLRFTTLDPVTLERAVAKVSTFKFVTNIIGTNVVVSPQVEEKTVTNAFWDNYFAGISVGYRLPYLLPFGLDVGYNAYRLQVKNKELAELQYQKALNEYIYNVRIAYYNYLFAKEFSKITIDTDKRLEENVRIAEANFRSGIFSDLELIRARVQLVNNKPNLFSSQNNLKLQKANLLVLLGIDVSEIDNVEIEGDINYIKRDFSNITINFDEEKKKVMENNIDLKILRKVIEVSESSKDISLGSNKPIISLFFNFNYEFKKTNNLDNERVWVDSWNAGVQLTIPISDLLPVSKSYANMESADYSIEKAKYNYVNTLNLILLQFEQSKLRFNESLQNIQAQEANVQQARRSLEIISSRYRFGNASSLDLIDAQLAYQQAEVNLLSAWVSYVNNILTIKRLTGEGFLFTSEKK
ncbi:MAG: TolC family protein [Spirochaetes bacterium]|nr:TolC family protein [Spirochaetota bacterium]